MNPENFERAVELHNRIENIYKLQCTLRNSQKRQYLAAIEVKELDDEGRNVKDCRVLNFTNIPDDILEKFQAILKEEMETLLKEFKDL